MRADEDRIPRHAPAALVSPELGKPHAACRACAYDITVTFRSTAIDHSTRPSLQRPDTMKTRIITTLLALATCLSGKTARYYILTMASALAMFLAQAALASDIPLEITQPGHVSAAIYSPEGQLVRELLHAVPMTAGKQSVVWDGLDRDGNSLPVGRITIRLDDANTGRVSEEIVSLVERQD